MILQTTQALGPVQDINRQSKHDINSFLHITKTEKRDFQNLTKTKVYPLNVLKRCRETKHKDSMRNMAHNFTLKNQWTHQCLTFHSFAFSAILSLWNFSNVACYHRLFLKKDKLHLIFPRGKIP
jgi:hypothetical protein